MHIDDCDNLDTHDTAEGRISAIAAEVEASISAAGEMRELRKAVAPRRFFWSPGRHPILGDELTFSDKISWFAQGIIRRWTFVILVCVISVTWWTNPLWFHDPTLVHWNAGASLLALIIESVVGIGMFNQTTRDALILRRLDRVLGAMDANTQADLDELERLDNAFLISLTTQMAELKELILMDMARHGQQ